jgi:hypothetical protein
MGSTDSSSFIPMIELPPELFTEWLQQAMTEHGTKPGTVAGIVAHKAVQWAADQELEACCQLLDINGCPVMSEMLRTARRPKPPSLKQQALEALCKGCFPSNDEISTIRRALEALPDD